MGRCPNCNAAINYLRSAEYGYNVGFVSLQGDDDLEYETDDFAGTGEIEYSCPDCGETVTREHHSAVRILLDEPEEDEEDEEDEEEEEEEERAAPQWISSEEITRNNRLEEIDACWVAETAPTAFALAPEERDTYGATWVRYRLELKARVDSGGSLLIIQSQGTDLMDSRQPLQNFRETELRELAAFKRSLSAQLIDVSNFHELASRIVPVIGLAPRFVFA